jgi:hypothetical protein
MFEPTKAQDMEDGKKISDDLCSSLEVLIKKDNPMADAAERTLERYRQE